MCVCVRGQGPSICSCAISRDFCVIVASFARDVLLPPACDDRPAVRDFGKVILYLMNLTACGSN